jgi:hypothetical protein
MFINYFSEYIIDEVLGQTTKAQCESVRNCYSSIYRRIAKSKNERVQFSDIIVSLIIIKHGQMRQEEFS